jgi:hypothetical protein
MKLNPTFTSFPNTTFVALDYHNVHHLTHIARTILAFHLTARLLYMLLTVFSFTSLCTQPLLSATVVKCTLGI